MLFSLSCYVLGCREPVTLSTRHKLFGLITCCPGHNPMRHGYGLPWDAKGGKARRLDAWLNALPPSPQGGDPGDGGLGARLLPPVPPIGPDGDGLPEPVIPAIPVIEQFSRMAQLLEDDPEVPDVVFSF